MPFSDPDCLNSFLEPKSKECMSSNPIRMPLKNERHLFPLFGCFVFALLLAGMTACSLSRTAQAEPVAVIDDSASGVVESSGSDQDVAASLHASGSTKSWDEQVEEAANRVDKIVDERDRLMEPLKKPTD